MNRVENRYSKLAPLNFQERLRLSLIALRFFSVMANEEMCASVGKPRPPNTAQPLNGQDFLTYLKRTGQLAEPDRYLHRIGDLLSDLCDARMLTQVGPNGGLYLGCHYYFGREFTNREAEGSLWLAPVLGPEFILQQYSHITVQIVGRTAAGDVTAGTALVIAPNWLLTCAHVLGDMEPERAQSLGNSTFTVQRTLIHDDIDVGLLEVAPVLSCLSGMAFRDPNIAEDVFTLGFPRIPLSRSPALVMHKGEVTNTSLTTFSGHDLFLFSATARPGNSGGPIIAASGHVVGIVSQELADQTSGLSLPFHAGVRTSQIAKAVSELDSSVSLPMEDYQ